MFLSSYGKDINMNKMEVIDRLLKQRKCRVCLSAKKDMSSLFRMCSEGNYAEMLTACTNVRVKMDDSLPQYICSKCCVNLERAFTFKKTAEASDRKLRKEFEFVVPAVPVKTKKILFDNLENIKSEFDLKIEPKVEPVDTSLDVLQDSKPILLHNTIIKKADGDTSLINPSTPDVSMKLVKKESYSDDDDMDDPYRDDGSDDDYIPLVKIKKKKPKVSSRIPFKQATKNKNQSDKVEFKVIKTGSDGKSNLVTCYTLSGNGMKGVPIIMKRPRDSSSTMKSLTRIKDKVTYKKTTTKIKIKDNTHKKDNRIKEKLVCPVCGILTYGLGNHMTTHAEKKKYNCTHCPKTFAQKANLETHLKTHTGTRDHVCEVCGAAFYNQKSLVRHNLIHKGDRPFECDLCSKRFIAKCDLNRHQRIHAGYKPYKCNTCSMSFNAKHQLQNHERMHTGERPYSCQVCNVAFSYKVNLNNHVLKVHNINLKFKSIYTVTEEVLDREHEIVNMARSAIHSAVAASTIAGTDVKPFDV